MSSAVLPEKGNVLDKNQSPSHKPDYGKKKPSQISNELNPCGKEAKLSMDCQNWGFNPTVKNDCQKYIDAYKSCLDVQSKKHIDPSVLKKREEDKKRSMVQPREAPPQ